LDLNLIYLYFQVKQRATDAKQALNMLCLLNDGVGIQNMLEAGGIDGSGFDFRQFKGSLDVESAAVMGHSFGGATTIQTLSEDRRFMLV
jgi:platelet-activating factor acetylhydrolase